MQVIESRKHHTPLGMVYSGTSRSMRAYVRLKSGKLFDFLSVFMGNINLPRHQPLHERIERGCSSPVSTAEEIYTSPSQGKSSSTSARSQSSEQETRCITLISPFFFVKHSRCSRCAQLTQRLVVGAIGIMAIASLTLTQRFSSTSMSPQP